MPVLEIKIPMNALLGIEHEGVLTVGAELKDDGFITWCGVRKIIFVWDGVKYEPRRSIPIWLMDKVCSSCKYRGICLVILGDEKLLTEPKKAAIKV